MTTTARQRFPFQSDVPIIFEAPEDAFNQNALDNSNDGATCSFKVFDPNRDEALSADEATGQTELSVTGAGVFEDGDTVEVSLDDGSTHATTVSSTDPSAGTITVADALPSAASEDARVRVRLGGEVAMTEYGTAKIGSRDYGFVGTLPDTHPGLTIGREIDVEIRFVGAPGGGLDALEVICGVVRPRAECEC